MHADPPGAVPPSWPVPRAVTATPPPTVCQAAGTATGPVQATCVWHAFTSGTANRRLDTPAAGTSKGVCPGAAGGAACSALSQYAVLQGSSALHTASGAHSSGTAALGRQGRARALDAKERVQRGDVQHVPAAHAWTELWSGWLATRCRVSPDSQPRTLRRARKQTRLPRTPRPGAPAPTACSLPRSFAAVRTPVGLLRC